MGLLGSDTFRQLLIREGRGCRGKGGALEKTIVQSWGRGWITSRDTNNSICALYRTEIPPKWKMLAFFILEKITV